MKTTELMLGNIVCLYSSGPVKKPCSAVLFKIMGLTNFTAQILRIDLNPSMVAEYITVSFTELAPVMLTEKVLLQMGIHKRGAGFKNYYIKADYNSYIEFEKWDEKNYKATLIDCDEGVVGKTMIAAHELQNRIFSLTEDQSPYITQD